MGCGKMNFFTSGKKGLLFQSDWSSSLRGPSRQGLSVLFLPHYRLTPAVHDYSDLVSDSVRAHQGFAMPVSGLVCVLWVSFHGQSEETVPNCGLEYRCLVWVFPNWLLYSFSLTTDCLVLFLLDSFLRLKSLVQNQQCLLSI